MQNALLFYEAIVAIQAREKQAPSKNAEEMWQRVLTAIQPVLDENDYFYLSLFAQALSEAKKLSTAKDFPFEHFGLFAHSLREFSSNGS